MNFWTLLFGSPGWKDLLVGQVENEMETLLTPDSVFVGTSSSVPCDQELGTREP